MMFHLKTSYLRVAQLVRYGSDNFWVSELPRKWRNKIIKGDAIAIRYDINAEIITIVTGCGTRKDEFGKMCEFISVFNLNYHDH